MSSACRGSNGAIPPRGRRRGGYGWGPGRPAQAPRPRAPGPQAPGPQAPQAPGPPTQAPVARVPRCFPWYFKHSPEIAFDPYILGRLVANGH